ncbi:hypothetical protein SESBI_02844 [Sesbania bispinosa]|nr:hypothetical protein SESBI_02844 [Sesbania bispinosa]
MEDCKMREGFLQKRVNNRDCCDDNDEKAEGNYLAEMRDASWLQRQGFNKDTMREGFHE